MRSIAAAGETGLDRADTRGMVGTDTRISEGVRGQAGPESQATLLR